MCLNFEIELFERYELENYYILLLYERKFYWVILFI